MSSAGPARFDGPGVPPIVLFVDDDQDTLDMYGGYFEEAGLWVAATTDPNEAFRTAAELKPNLIVADLGFGDEPSGVELVGALKTDALLGSTPIIVVSGRSRDELDEAAARGADVVLSKPLPPETLLQRASALLKRCRTLRERSRDCLSRGHEQQARSAELRGRNAAFAERAFEQRRCPTCGSLLEWIERGTIGAVEYDYYHWCDHGCGLFCFERRTGKWVKLA